MVGILLRYILLGDLGGSHSVSYREFEKNKIG